MNFTDYDFAPTDLDVKTSELLIATPDTSDPLVDSCVHQVLRLLRDQHRMEAAFVGELVDGRRVFRHAAESTCAQFIDEHSDPLELAYCKHALNVRVPFGCFLSAPVVLADGNVYGMFYSFSFSPDEGMQSRELKKLEMSAQLAARLIDSRAPAPAAARSSAHAPLAQAA
jgi:hypothetical protein